MAQEQQNRRKIHLVQGSSPERRKFTSGETACQSGIYQVVHEGHRLPHEVTMLSGQTFPPCSKCADAVHFQLMRPVLEDETPSAFRVTLNQLPEIAQEPDEQRRTG